MRAKMTKKAVLAQSTRVLKANYTFKCLVDQARIFTDFYTAGVYGWNADVYDFGDGCVLVAGYRPFGAEYISSEDEKRVRFMVESHASVGEVRALLHEIIEDTIPFSRPLD